MGIVRIPNCLKMGCAVFSIASAAWTLTDLSGVDILGIGMVVHALGKAADIESHGYVSSEYGLLVREAPDADSEEVALLPIGTEVEGPERGGWIRIENGYVKADEIQQESPIELIGEWRVTAYAETGYPCANGEYPVVGKTIAQNTLEFGTEVYIEGVGVRTVEDRGPDWLGSSWCDLYLGDTETCIQWGDQTRTVWLVK